MPPGLMGAVPDPVLIEYRTHITASGNGVKTITAPSTIQKGDILILIDFTVTLYGDQVIPAGFTSILSRTGPAVSISCKVADGSEAGTTLQGLAGFDGGGANGYTAKLLLVFQANARLFTPSTFNQQRTDGNPSPQTVLAGGKTNPLIVLAFYYSYGVVDPRTFSPAKDSEVKFSTSHNVWAAWKVFNTGHQDVSVDMDDEGSANLLISGLIEAL